MAYLGSTYSVLTLAAGGLLRPSSSTMTSDSGLIVTGPSETFSTLKVTTTMLPRSGSGGSAKPRTTLVRRASSTVQESLPATAELSMDRVSGLTSVGSSGVSTCEPPTRELVAASPSTPVAASAPTTIAATSATSPSALATSLSTVGSSSPLPRRKDARVCECSAAFVRALASEVYVRCCVTPSLAGGHTELKRFFTQSLLGFTQRSYC